MIVIAAPPIALSAVAQALGRRERACWLSLPRAQGMAGAEIDLRAGVEVLASDPIDVVEGASVEDLAVAWRRARRVWGDDARAGVPIGVGQLAYDLGREWHGLAPRQGVTSAPIEFRFYDALWIAPADGAAEIWAVDGAAAERLRARVAADVVEGPTPAFALSAFEAIEPPGEHQRSVGRILDYLRAGDAYQVNLARRLRAQLQAEGPPGLALFEALRAQAPAPHALWLGDAGRRRALIGNSPERFLHLSHDGWLETAPIKGTRPRGATAAEDAAQIVDLQATAKDRAEHVMIVDLERNDLGRICEVGSVHVAELLRVMKLPSVLHLVSRVRGRLRPGTELPAILHATFPGGSITGAPKRRAMEIIDELEPAPRGPYTGATGWLGAAGDFDLAVAIRTATLADETLTLWVGGGVVIDSTPVGELAETEVKARAFAALATSGASR